MLITLSAAAMRARIQSIIALKSSLSDEYANVLTPDRDFALNQQLVFHFLAAMMRIAPSVADYKIEPSNYYEAPGAELMLQINLKMRDGLDARQMRDFLENYIALMTLSTILVGISDGSESRTYADDAKGYLDRLADEIDATDFSSLRISRTI
ncbi:MAG: hypothetical protein K2J07_01725 [Muribaculaceae bacterium]|nr:hypothetical protein [Muribaculaceae bacterium]